MTNERKFDIEVALETRRDSCLLSLNRLSRDLVDARECGDEADFKYLQGQLSWAHIMLEEFEYLLSRVKEG